MSAELDAMTDSSLASLRADLEAARGEAERLREVLRSVEWVQGRRRDVGYYCCPVCRGIRDCFDGHAPGCALAAALEK